MTLLNGASSKAGNVHHMTGSSFFLKKDMSNSETEEAVIPVRLLTKLAKHI